MNTKRRITKKLWFLLMAMALTLSAAVPSQAHFVWIETDPVNKTGGDSLFNIYFGEYHEGLREKRGGRLDERQGFELRAVDSSGKISQPIPWNTEENHFEGRVNLQEPGVYDLVGTDSKSPVVDYTKYGIGVVRPIFYARTRVLSYRENFVSKKAVKLEPALDLDILPVTQHLNAQSEKFSPAPGEDVMYRVFFKGKPLTERAEILVYAPNGWMWEGKLDSEGNGRFKPLWPGSYVVDVVFKEKSPGNFMGKDFEFVRHRATLTLVVQSGHGQE